MNKKKLARRFLEDNLDIDLNYLDEIKKQPRNKIEFMGGVKGWYLSTKPDYKLIKSAIEFAQYKNKVSDKVAFWLDQVALRFNLIRWLSVSDDVNIYINTMISLVNDIDFTKAKGTLVEDYILEVKEANKLDISFKEKIEYIADFQDNLLNLELAETLEDLGYSRDLLITLNNKSVRAAKEA